jgi:hypothetical protein
MRCCTVIICHIAEVQASTGGADGKGNNKAIDNDSPTDSAEVVDASELNSQFRNVDLSNHCVSIPRPGSVERMEFLELKDNEATVG